MVDDEDYRTLAAFRHALREFLAFSEAAARESGLTPQQHQAILAMRSREPHSVSVGDLAEMLLVRPHTAVELVDRLVKADLVVRTQSEEDKRRVVLDLTQKAEGILDALSSVHLSELRRSRPMLVDLLTRIDQR